MDSEKIIFFVIYFQLCNHLNKNTIINCFKIILKRITKIIINFCTVISYRFFVSYSKFYNTRFVFSFLYDFKLKNIIPRKKHIRCFENSLFIITYVSTKKLVRTTCGNTFMNHRKSLDRYTYHVPTTRVFPTYLNPK